MELVLLKPSSTVRINTVCCVYIASTANQLSAMQHAMLLDRNDASCPKCYSVNTIRTMSKWFSAFDVTPSETDSPASYVLLNLRTWRFIGGNVHPNAIMGWECCDGVWMHRSSRGCSNDVTLCGLNAGSERFGGSNRITTYHDSDLTEALANV